MPKHQSRELTAFDVAEIISGIYPDRTWGEVDLQDEIAERLDRAGIWHQREARLSPEDRIDFLVEGGIGIEVKSGVQNRSAVRTQLVRYAQHEKVNALILATERNLAVFADELSPPLKPLLCGKLFFNVWFTKNLGIAS